MSRVQAETYANRVTCSAEDAKKTDYDRIRTRYFILIVWAGKFPMRSRWFGGPRGLGFHNSRLLTSSHVVHSVRIDLTKVHIAIQSRGEQNNSDSTRLDWHLKCANYSAHRETIEGKVGFTLELRSRLFQLD